MHPGQPRRPQGFALEGAFAPEALETDKPDILKTWQDMGVKYVIESTGLFVEYEWLVDTLSVHGVLPGAAFAWVPP